jgi:hypothetical protein
MLRCGQQACAYAIEQGNTAKLLVQPCDMHPGMVDKCACTTEVSLELDEEAIAQVELWLRPDDYGQSGANPPRLVDTAFLRPTCGGENPSDRCRTSADECLPSLCACGEGTWICTADCSGGRICREGGTSEDTAPAAR